MARGRDPGKPNPRPVLGFRTFADDTPRQDLDPAARRDDPWPEPDYVDPEDLAWEAPPARRAAPQEEIPTPRWPALLIVGLAVAGLAGAWGYDLLRRGPLPARMRAAPTAAAPAARPSGRLAVEPAPAAAAAPPLQRLDAARLAPHVAASRRRAAPHPPPTEATPPAIPAEPPAAPAPPAREAPAPAPAPEAPAAEDQTRSAGTLERQAPPPRQARAAPAPRPLDCASIRSAAQDIVCRDPGLMAAERRMDRAYAAALAAGAPEATLREDQDDWRRIRELAARRSKQAVEDIYHQRIDELEAMAGPR